MSERLPILEYAPEATRDEWGFLIRCVAMQLAVGGDVAPPMPDAVGLNWNTILQLAETNRVVPLLSAAVLANEAQRVPPEVVADLNSRFRHCAQKGFAYAVELRQLLGSLRQAQIRCIPLKGPVLTMGSYRRMGLRDFDDLDLLVTPADVPGAVAVLARLGYSGWDIPVRRLASHLSTESEHNLICQERKVTVDLHWAIGRKYFTMPMDFEALWQRTVRTKLIGAEVPDLCAEDLLLFLCYHGGKHLFVRLAWICDVAATIAAHPKLDWDLLVTRAKQMGARRLLLLGLGLAHHVFASDIPIRLKELIDSEPSLRNLEVNVLRGMFGAANSKSALKQQFEASLFHLRVRERTSDRLRYLFWAAAPNARDWRDSRLPRLLTFLLVLSRPFRLLKKNWLGDVARR